MSRNALLGIIGVFVALIPSLGFPQSFESGFLVTAGVSITILAVISHREKRIKELFSREFFDHLRHRSPAFKDTSVDIEFTNEKERTKI